MTNFEQYLAELTQEKFIQSMILNCDGCPNYSCMYREEGGVIQGDECEEELRKWCEEAD